MSAFALAALALPLAAGLIALVGRGRHRVDLVTAALAAATFAAAAAMLGGSARPLGITVDLGGATATLGVVAGPVEGLLALVATGIGVVVAAASARALRGEAEAARFAGSVALVVAATVAVATGASLVVVALGWIGVTIALAGLLIVDPEVPGALDAARRVRRRLLVGDAAVVAGVVTAAVTLGDLDVRTLGDQAGPGSTALMVTLVLLAVGGFVRSAQIPAHGWLPWTIWAPSPTSALLHAGVVNGAGVLLVRLWPAVGASAPVLHLAVVVGAATALLGAAATLVRPDVKGALVRSTTAQMGFMVLQIGLGNAAAAVFHLVAHGSYKAARFLGSGSLVHAERAGRTDPPTTRQPATAGRWALAGAPAAVGVAVVAVGFGDKPGAIVLVAALGATAVAAAHAVVVRAASLATVALAGVAIGTLAVAYGGAVDRLAALLGFDPAPAAPGVAVQLSVVAAAVAAVALVRARPTWLYRHLLSERIRIPRPAALPTPALVHPIARATVRSRVAVAGELVGPSWPLTGFVASNPLADLEGASFEEATAYAGDLRPGRTHLTHDRYLELRRSGRITDRHLTAALGEVLPGLVETGSIHLDGRPVDPVDAGRRILLADPDPLGAARPGDAVRTPAEWIDATFGTDLLGQIDREVARWVAAHVDVSQATWTLPGRERGLWSAWRALDPRVAELPERADDALVAALAALHVPDDQVTATLRRSLGQQPGWAAHLRWRATAPDEVGRPRPPADLVDLLALRLTLEARAVAGHAARVGVAPTLDALAAVAPDLGPTSDPSTPAGPSPATGTAALARAADELGLTAARHRQVWLVAHERALRTELLDSLGRSTPVSGRDRPLSQVATCIDVRSEVLRRHLEQTGPHETIGIAGFFAAAVRHHPLAGRGATDQCPVLVRPRADVVEHPVASSDPTALAHRGRRAELGHIAHHAKAGVATPFVFVEIVGWAALVELVGRTAAPVAWARWRRRIHDRLVPPVATRIAVDLDVDEQALVAETALRLVGLTEGFARLVLWCGHGSTTENNPHESALDCGACGGNPGGVNARVLATILNHRSVRDELATRGIVIPDDTWFLAGQHDTTTERVALVDVDLVPATHRTELDRLVADLAEAGRRAATDRCRALPGAPGAARAGNGDVASRHLLRRASDWAQIRAEWGLVGCHAFVIGPRELTRGVDLGGRVFLHSYRPDRDPDGTALETILTAPLVVAEWIATQYYFSTVDDLAYGAGPKLCHNVVGGSVGVLLGGEGDLRIGLPRESVASGGNPVHEPVRLLAVVEAPLERIGGIVVRNPVLQRLIGNGWIALVARPGDEAPWSRLGQDLCWTRWNGTIPTSPGADRPSESAVIT